MNWTTTQLKFCNSFLFLISEKLSCWKVEFMWIDLACMIFMNSWVECVQGDSFACDSMYTERRSASETAIEFAILITLSPLINPKA